MVAVGFSNRDLIQMVGALSREPYTSRQATYDLRRLIRKGLIVKIPHTRRYQLTTIGRRVAVLFTKTYGRVLAPGLGALDPRPSLVAAHWPWRGTDSNPPWTTLSRATWLQRDT